VWQGVITPLLSEWEAARLRGVSKALKGVVNEMPLELDNVDVREDLRMALTCFPAAESLHLSLDGSLEAAEESTVVELLREHGETLKRVTAATGPARRLLSSAVQAGALPKLSCFWVSVADPVHRQVLSDGRFKQVAQMDVTATDLCDGQQLAALEHLRHLPKLHSLSVTWGGPTPQAVVPLFIPASLKSLTLNGKHGLGPLVALLQVLPSTLQESSARLEEVTLCQVREFSAEGADATAEVLCTCSSSLKGFTWYVSHLHGTSDDCAAQVASGLASCCGRLEHLRVPLSVFRRLPATCTSFPHLNKLNLYCGEDEPTAFGSPVWDRLTAQQLPVLANLSITGPGLYWGDEPEGREEYRLVRALTAVAPTLRRLTISDLQIAGYGDPPECLGRQLASAIGKMRRLRFLSLCLGESGHTFQHAAPWPKECPELFEVHLDSLDHDADLVLDEESDDGRTVLLPSVRVLRCTSESLDEHLVLCCGLVERGYKYRYEAVYRGAGGVLIDPHEVLPCLRHILSLSGAHVVVAWD
jgi:hypothetical protein